MPKKSRRQRAATPYRPGAGQTRRLPQATPEGTPAATATATPPSEAAAPAKPVGPRPVAKTRPVAPGRPGVGAGGKPLDYSRVLKEARRMAILAAALFIILAIIGFIVNR